MSPFGRSNYVWIPGWNALHTKGFHLAPPRGVSPCFVLSRGPNADQESIRQTAHIESPMWVVLSRCFRVGWTGLGWATPWWWQTPMRSRRPGGWVGGVGLQASSAARSGVCASSGTCRSDLTHAATHLDRLGVPSVGARPVALGGELSEEGLNSRDVDRLIDTGHVHPLL